MILLFKENNNNLRLLQMGQLLVCGLCFYVCEIYLIFVSAKTAKPCGKRMANITLMLCYISIFEILLLLF